MAALSCAFAFADFDVLVADIIWSWHCHDYITKAHMYLQEHTRQLHRQQFAFAVETPGPAERLDPLKLLKFAGTSRPPHCSCRGLSDLASTIGNQST